VTISRSGLAVDPVSASVQIPAVTAIKICGVTRVEDALMLAEAGVDAIGVILWPGSPRHVSLPRARAIAEAVGGRMLVVGVVVDLDVPSMVRLRDEARLGCLQLHGDEPPEALEALLPHAYKALRASGAELETQAARYGGQYVLIDAHVTGARGGTGRRADWMAAARLARTRKVALAGGLGPDDVAEAIAVVRPFCVDMASGVERAVGIKDEAKVRRVVEEVRRADARA
jgi:phosphoribosylanthranilate isomerase